VHTNFANDGTLAPLAGRRPPRAYRVKTLPASDRAYLIDIKVDPCAWTEEGRVWWEVGSPDVSSRPEALVAAAEIDQGGKRQRRGV
jgi:TPP-dependent trihydroxycyclohexane-1,2-dione (THcHDO) dehydratase